MRGLREAMAGADYLAVKAWIESVDAASKEFAERRMNKHVAKAMAGHRVDEFAGALAEHPRVTGSKEDDLENDGAAAMPKVTFLPDGKSASRWPRGDVAPRRRRRGRRGPAVELRGRLRLHHLPRLGRRRASTSLSEIEEREDDKLQEAAGLSTRSRLACQARVGAQDVVVRIPGNRIKA